MNQVHSRQQFLRLALKHVWQRHLLRNTCPYKFVLPKRIKKDPQKGLTFDTCAGKMKSWLQTPGPRLIHMNCSRIWQIRINKLCQINEPTHAPLTLLPLWPKTMLCWPRPSLCQMAYCSREERCDIWIQVHVCPSVKLQYESE